MRFGPSSICRQDRLLIESVYAPDTRSMALCGTVLTTIGGSALYGLSFGCWHGVNQAVIAAIKLPILIFAVVGTTGLISALLAKMLDPQLDRWQIGYGLLSGFAVAASILGACSPVLIFFALQLPSPHEAQSMLSYRILLVTHTACVGIAGISGFVRLRSYLERMTGFRKTARKLLAAWIPLCGLAGCEWSWVLSPFLARPDMPVPLMNPNAFNCNFFEYLWLVIKGGL